MQKLALISAAAVALLAPTADARISSGACANPTLQSDFDITKYTGLWYEIRRDNEFIFE